MTLLFVCLKGRYITKNMSSSINVSGLNDIGEESKSGYEGYDDSNSQGGGGSSDLDENSSHYVEQADDFDKGLSNAGSLTSLLAASEYSEEEEHENGLISPVDVS